MFIKGEYILNKNKHGCRGTKFSPILLSDEIYELFMKGRRLANNTILLLLAISSANKEEGKQRLLIYHKLGSSVMDVRMFGFMCHLHRCVNKTKK